MDDRTARRYASYLGADVARDSGEYKLRCPRPEHDDHRPSAYFWFSKRKGKALWTCRTCLVREMATGDAIDLTKLLLGCGAREAVRTAQAWLESPAAAEFAKLRPHPLPSPTGRFAPESWALSLSDRRAGERLLKELFAARGPACVDAAWVAEQFEIGGNERDGVIAIPYDPDGQP